MTAPNVLLQQIANGLWKAKIADFGSANLARLSNTAGEGNILYTAPEIHPLTSDEHTTKIDVFSYGILLCEVVNAKLPEVLKDLLEEVKCQSPPLHTLITSCIKRDPAERPAMDGVIDVLHQIPEIRQRRLSI